MDLSLISTTSTLILQEEDTIYQRESQKQYQLNIYGVYLLKKYIAQKSKTSNKGFYLSIFQRFIYLTYSRKY